MGLLILGLTEGKTSLRELELVARADARAWWLCAGLCPDHSTLGKFIHRHRETLTEQFFEELTRAVLKAIGGNTSRLAGDGTVIEAVSSRASMLKQEAAEQAAAEAKARADAAPEDDSLKRQAAMAQQAAETSKQRSEDRKRKGRKNTDAPVCPTEPEAVLQRQKNKTTRPSYKPSILATEQRLIVGHDVDPSNEAKVVEPMLEQAERIGGQKPQELLLDAGYFSALVVLLCYSADLSLLCPQGKSEAGRAKPKSSSKQFPKNCFRYDESRDEYLCPAGQRLQNQGQGGPDSQGRKYVKYRCDVCDGCSLRAQCTESKRGRTLNRYEHEALLEAQLGVMENDQAQRVYLKRQAMVEPVFGELRYIQGLVRFRRRGLQGVQVEFSLHAAAHNVRRYLRLRVLYSEDGSARSGSKVGADLRLLVLSLVQGLSVVPNSSAVPLCVMVSW